MLFSSIIFIFYFLPVTLAVYYLLRFSRRAQNFWLLIASLFFYAWGEPVFVGILLLSIIFNHYMGIVAEKSRENREKKRRVMIVTCVLNLALLFYYKYLGFVLQNIGMLIKYADDLPFYDIALPLGISFFTFQAISYVADISSGEANAQKNPLNTALYIAFFPQLIAGPIVRYVDIERQIESRRCTWDGFSYGVSRFIIGLAKKILIANIMATVSTHVFNYSAMSEYITKVPVSLAWIGAVAYMLQIYYDFSGYSDMAIGLAKMFGFELTENFNYPYVSLSISEFWRRWHISLYNWFKKYVYIPLGGSRVKNNDLMIRNLFVVWILTGIWHGANWTFILWGLWQFLFVVFERTVEFEKVKIPLFLRRAYVLIVSLFGWVIFRSNDLYQVTQFFGNMLGLNHNGFFDSTALMFLREHGLFFIVGIIFATPLARRFTKVFNDKYVGKLNRVFAVMYSLAFTGVFLITVTYLIKGTYNPFIYFNF